MDFSKPIPLILFDDEGHKRHRFYCTSKNSAKDYLLKYIYIYLLQLFLNHRHDHQVWWELNLKNDTDWIIYQKVALKAYAMNRVYIIIKSCQDVLYCSNACVTGFVGVHE